MGDIPLSPVAKIPSVSTWPVMGQPTRVVVGTPDQIATSTPTRAHNLAAQAATCPSAGGLQMGGTPSVGSHARNQPLPANVTTHSVSRSAWPMLLRTAQAAPDRTLAAVAHQEARSTGTWLLCFDELSVRLLGILEPWGSLQPHHQQRESSLRDKTSLHKPFRSTPYLP